MSSTNRATGEETHTSATTDGDEATDSEQGLTATGDTGHAVQKRPTYEAPFGDGKTVKSLIETAWGDRDGADIDADRDGAADSDDDPTAVIDEVWADLTS